MQVVTFRFFSPRYHLPCLDQHAMFHRFQKTFKAPSFYRWLSLFSAVLPDDKWSLYPGNIKPGALSFAIDIECFTREQGLDGSYRTRSLHSRCVKYYRTDLVF
jgi:hypothetical protein